MMKSVALLVVLAIAAEAVLTWDSPAITQEMINEINSDPKSTWTAGFNKKFEGASLKDVMRLCGTFMETKKPENVVDYVAGDIPNSFDARTEFKACGAIIGHIRDQSTCGSCWAFGAVEAFEDRMCIATNGAVQVLSSPEDILTCCGITCGSGCNGGTLAGAWSYITSKGLVSGGDYGDKKSCQPYYFAPCDHHVNGTLPPCGESQPTPKCDKNCQSGYSKTWDADKRFAAKHYAISSSVTAIQTEIMTHGPVECAFTVYSDFTSYRSGVYQHKSGSQLGGHAIKVMGWGVENDTPYWLVANSWNEEWGDKGTFKILRGKNECGIESQCHAGDAKTA